MPADVVVSEQVAPAPSLGRRVWRRMNYEGRSPTLYLASAICHEIVNIAMVVCVGEDGLRVFRTRDGRPMVGDS